MILFSTLSVILLLGAVAIAVICSIYEKWRGWVFIPILLIAIVLLYEFWK